MKRLIVCIMITIVVFWLLEYIYLTSDIPLESIDNANSFSCLVEDRSSLSSFEKKWMGLLVKLESLIKDKYIWEYSGYSENTSRIDSSAIPGLLPTITTNIRGKSVTARDIMAAQMYSTAAQKVIQVKLKKFFSSSLITYRGVIVVKWEDGDRGGWGDRAKTYAIALMLGMLLHRKVEFYLEPKFPLTEYVSPNCYNWKIEESTTKSLLDGKFTKLCSSGCDLNIVLDGVERAQSAQPSLEDWRLLYDSFSVITVQNIYFPACDVLRNHAITKSIFGTIFPRQIPCEDVIGTIIRYLFKPKLELYKKITSKIRTPTIPIHIRMGGEWGDAVKIVNHQIAEFFDCAKLIGEQFIPEINNITLAINNATLADLETANLLPPKDAKDINWFIAADNEQAITMLEALSREMNIRIIHNTGTIGHVGNNGEKFANDSAAGLKRVMQDWWTIVFSNSMFTVISPMSGFSQTASWAGIRIPVGIYHYQNKRNTRSTRFLVCDIH